MPPYGFIYFILVSLLQSEHARCFPLQLNFPFEEIAFNSNFKGDTKKSYLLPNGSDSCMVVNFMQCDFCQGLWGQSCWTKLPFLCQPCPVVQINHQVSFELLWTFKISKAWIPDTFTEEEERGATLQSCTLSQHGIQ
jgi:hypothetical protein